jgi:hypothetical protein
MTRDDATGRAASWRTERAAAVAASADRASAWRSDAVRSAPGTASGVQRRYPCDVAVATGATVAAQVPVRRVRTSTASAPSAAARRVPPDAAGASLTWNASAATDVAAAAATAARRAVRSSQSIPAASAPSGGLGRAEARWIAVIAARIRRRRCASGADSDRDIEVGPYVAILVQHAASAAATAVIAGAVPTARSTSNDQAPNPPNAGMAPETVGASCKVGEDGVDRSTLPQVRRRGSSLWQDDFRGKNTGEKHHATCPMPPITL